MSSFFFGSGKNQKESSSEVAPDTAGSIKSSSPTKSEKSEPHPGETDILPKPTTTKIQTKPAPGTKVGPIHEYDEKQKEMMKQVKEVRICIYV